ncbi:ATP-dependent RNA helicase [Leptospira sp. GIMC2001]|uniref:ATP-dependent RNA helicase n=1 Tax=Leptospira sp. GIMC2001 TaxID=1513297 RepID=UPI00234934C7|nr:ATP-dependent helicase C-terminal domain-containing protein [Leptospira sp. GIMC2001]WCL49811.1 DEAD/DEAH box helicase [Leptospira sp. GIMC2001]
MLPSYPVKDILPQIDSFLSSHSTILIKAPPGSGKTTLVPLHLLQHLQNNETILMLEPRRIATVQSAQRMAEIINQAVGDTVGYQVRYQRKISKQTRIEVVTEGIFLKRYQTDPELQNVKYLILDEFHERSKDADLSLALALETVKLFRPELKIIIMSATLDTNEISKFLLNCPVVETTGNLFPVQIEYKESSIESAIIKSINKHSIGDILVFLPGTREIRNLQNKLSIYTEFECFGLYGALELSEQRKVILGSSSGKRRVILSTNIAETSLTIEGVRIVIDSGLVKKYRFDLRTGLAKWEVNRIALDSAEQRAGRAGRLGPGFCYRIWSEKELMNQRTIPEILNTDISALILSTQAMGFQIEELSWIDPPTSASISVGRSLLEWLNILDSNGSISSLGTFASMFPLPPRLSILCLRSLHFDAKAKDFAISLALELSEEDLFGDKRDRFFREIHSILTEIEKSQNFQNLFPKYDFKVTRGILLSYAFPDRIAKLRDGQDDRYITVMGKGSQLSKDSILKGEKWLVAWRTEGDSGEAIIYEAESIPINQLEKLFYNDKRMMDFLSPTVKPVARKIKSQDTKESSNKNIENPLFKNLPKVWTSPKGRNVKVEFENGRIVLSVKIQDLFGGKESPKFGNGNLPITWKLLSPANRPVQITSDLDGFWKGSYKEIRKELKSRYPKHEWPENPY